MIVKKSLNVKVKTQKAYFKKKINYGFVFIWSHDFNI